MSDTLSDSTILSRCILSDAAAAQFREEARMIVFVDPETQGRVVLYAHPNGHVLVDAVRLPPNTP